MQYSVEKNMLLHLIIYGGLKTLLSPAGLFYYYLMSLIKQQFHSYYVKLFWILAL